MLVTSSILDLVQGPWNTSRTIIEPTLVHITQHIVGLVDSRHFFRSHILIRICAAIRMPLHAQFSVGLLNFVRCCRFRDT